MVSTSYPATGYSLWPVAGASYNYSYDSMNRLSGMKTSGGTTVVSNVTYNAANQLLTMNYDGLAETRTYNTLNQLTNITAGTSENLTYSYPTTGTNNGKVSSMYNAISGETVTYTYDSLNRLLTANGSGWGEQYGFDGFGNLLSKTVTAGSGPSLSQAVNPANNQIVGQSYDANGNASTVNNNGLTYNVGYDAENRLSTITSSSTELAYYSYDAQNKRIFSGPAGADQYGNLTNYTVYVYSPSGQRLGGYQLATAFVDNSKTNYVVTPTLQVTGTSNDQYFGGRRLAVMDQLGSAGTYYPWGEAKGGSNPQDTWNFATYWQDSVSGLNYANNRYYSNSYGRFMTPDPYTNSGRLSDPQSWNRYAYTRGDPVNRLDPLGTADFSVTGWGWGDPFSGFWESMAGPNFNPSAAAQCMATLGCYTPLPGGGNFQAPGTANPLGATGAQAGAFVLEQAVDLAMQVLSLPSCSKLFAPLAGPPPAVLLLDLYAGTTSYGNIKFGAIAQGTPGVTTYATTTSGITPINSTTGQALITLQTQGAGASLWAFSGAPSYVNAAATIIHELGHAANIIFGPGSSSIVDDVDNTAQSTANQNTVLQDCFGSSPF